jgi:hypothetical protein
MKLVQTGCAVLLALISPGHGDSATFLPDGKQVLWCGDGKLQVKNLDDLSESELAFPPELKPGYSPLGLTAEGLLLVAGKSLAMTWNPSTKEWKTLWKSPEGWSFDGLACDPKSGGTLFVLRSEEYELEWKFLARGAAEPARVYNRRAKGASDPWFDAEGNLFFICSGDVWKGEIGTGDSEEVPFVLSGTRMWPLAQQETGPSNSSGLAAKSVVAFGPQLFVELSRAGGSGWGNIVRMPNQDPYENGLPLKWEELEEAPSGAGITLSPDAKKLAIFIVSANRWFVVEAPDGEMIPVPRSKE